MSKERRRRRIRTIFRERRSDLRSTHKRSYYHFAPRLREFSYTQTTHHHHHRILSEAIFSAHRFCEGPPFQKAKHFSTSDGNSKKSVSSPRMYVCWCVCVSVCSRARICASSFAREDERIRDDKERTYFIHPCASTSSQDVILWLFMAAYEFDLCFGTNVQSSFGLPRNISLTLIQSSTLSEANKVSISFRPKYRCGRKCIFCTLACSKRPTGTYLCV